MLFRSGIRRVVSANLALARYLNDLLQSWLAVSRSKTIQKSFYTPFLASLTPRRSSRDITGMRCERNFIIAIGVETTFPINNNWRRLLLFKLRNCGRILKSWKRQNPRYNLMFLVFFFVGDNWTKQISGKTSFGIDALTTQAQQVLSASLKISSCAGWAMHHFRTGRADSGADAQLIASS